MIFYSVSFFSFLLFSFNFSHIISFDLYFDFIFSTTRRYTLILNAFSLLLLYVVSKKLLQKQQLAKEEEEKRKTKRVPSNKIH